MEDEIQVVPLDLTIGSGILCQNNKKIQEDTTGQNTDTITEQENKPFFAHNINDPVASTSHAAAQTKRQLMIYENNNQVKNSEEQNSIDQSHTEIPAKFVIGSPDCSSCNNTRYFESIIANVEKKVDRLKKSMKNRKDPVDNTLVSNCFNFGPTLYGSRDMQERLFHQFQAHPYNKPEYYKNYYTKETRRSETIQIYDLGNVDDKQMLVDLPENVKQNLNEMKLERHNDIRIISTIGQENLQGQYLVPKLHINPTVLEEPSTYIPQLHINPAVLEEPSKYIPQLHINPAVLEEQSKYIPIVPRNENWVSSTNVEINAYETYYLNRNTMLSYSNTQISEFNSRYAVGNILPEEQSYWQPIRMGFSTEELDELLTEIQNIEAYVATMDTDVNGEAFSIERFCPEYWAFLTNKLIKIKTQQYLLNGFNDTYCDKILSRVNTLGKFPQEYWRPVNRPPVIESCSSYVPQEEDKPKIILKLSRNVKEKVSNRRSYNRGGGGRQRRKNPGCSWSVKQTEISDQPQDHVQAAEVSTDNHEEKQQ